MNCREYQRELSAYLDGEVTGAVRTEIEAHVAGCADCRQRLTELRQIAAGVAALPKLQPVPRFVAEVRRKIRGAERTSWFDTLFRPVWLKVPLEAVALVAVLGTVLVWVSVPRPREMNRAPLTDRAERGQQDKKELLAEAAPPPPLTMGSGALGGAQSLEATAPQPSAMKTAVAKKVFPDQPVAAAAPLAYSAPAEPRDAVARLQAVETITVEDADAVAVQKQAEQVANALGGRLLPSTPAAPTFQVEVPRQNVVAFKSQFPRRPQALARARETAAAADQEEAKRQDADPAMTVVEIQVVPPR